MPIAKDQRALYPKNWAEISLGRRRQAGYACEGSPQYPNCAARNGEPHPDTGSRVVLTVAHLDHDPANCHPDNLKAWCQRCHNTYDMKHRQGRAARTRRSRLPQLDLLDRLA